MTGVAFFEQKLSDLCVGWLEDCVFQIREVHAHGLSHAHAHQRIVAGAPASTAMPVSHGPSAFL